MFRISLGFIAILLFVIIPYNTFGEDVKMFKDSGLTSVMLLAILVAAFGLGFAGAATPVMVVAFGALLTLSNYWFSAAFHAYQAELFPTRLRATGVGFTYSWSRLSAVFSSLLIGAVLVRGGVGAVFTLLAAAMCGVALIIGVLGPRTNRIALEQLAS